MAFPSVVNLGALTAAEGFQVTGAMPDDELGSEVAYVGDVNGDGLGDFALNTISTSTLDGGATYIVFGVAGGYPNFWLGTEDGVTNAGEPDGLPEGLGFRIYAGRALAYSGMDISHGDVNGDGFSDIVLGSPRWPGDNGYYGYDGSVFVVYGKAAGHTDVNLSTLTPAQGARIEGQYEFDDIGWYETTSVGDIDGDGFGDIIMGAGGYDPTVGGTYRTSAGATYVVWGKAGGIADINLATLAPADGFRVDGADAFDSSGESVASVGDVNGDGLGDFVIGAQGADPQGRTYAGAAFVIYGSRTRPTGLDLAALTPAQGFRIEGATTDDWTGKVVEAAGDVNGDGLADLLIGAEINNPGGLNYAGTAWIVFGRQGGHTGLDLAALTPAQGVRIDGVAADQRIGSEMSVADVNGDGLSDVILGVYNADYGDERYNEGATFVVYGREDGAMGVNLLTMSEDQGFRIDGADFAGESGVSVEGLSDVNGDGVDDILIGAHHEWGLNDQLQRSGRAYVVYGRGPIGLQNGTAAADVLDGTVEVDTIRGRGGDDVLRGLEGGDTLEGGAGRDQLFGGAGGDTLRGGTEADLLDGGTDHDLLEGGDGADVLRGGAGADVIDGGAGTDTIDFRDQTQTVALVLAGADPAQATVGGAAADTVRNVEHIYGGAAGDVLGGDAGNNAIQGFGGNDVLAGGAGRDLLDGGFGTGDIADYRAETTAVTVVLKGASDAAGFVNGVAEDTLRGMEGVYGGAAADRFYGDAGANVLNGFGGNDIIRGGAGADTLVGGAGLDIADYADKTAAVAFTLALDTLADVRVGGVLEDKIAGFESVYGGSAADTMTGDVRSNLFRGGGGADRLNGGGGVDSVDFRDKVAAVTLTLAGGTDATATVGGAAEDVVRNFENVYGGAGGDTLTGDTLANLLSGETGADTLRGAGGADTLTGGAGADVFRFATLGDSTVDAAGRDRITDFTRAQADKIDLRGIDAIAGGADNAFAIAAAFAVGQAGRLVVSADGAGRWLVQGDVDGGGTADFAISVVSATALEAVDFLL